jgi:hypothetical protein
MYQKRKQHAALIISPIFCLKINGNYKSSLIKIKTLNEILLEKGKEDGGIIRISITWGDRWGSNPRQQESQSWTLPTELRSP